jgi:hypothetical protein
MIFFLLKSLRTTSRNCLSLCSTDSKLVNSIKSFVANICNGCQTYKKVREFNFFKLLNNVKEKQSDRQMDKIGDLRE